MNISFIGLGKLGLSLALCIANNKNKIVAIDKNKVFLKKLKNKKFQSDENKVNKLLKTKRKYIKSYSSNLSDAITETNVTCVLVNTQHKKDGYSSKNINNVFNELSCCLKNKKKYHLFILSSTVPPGTINNLIKEIELKSKKKFNKHFGFVYIPDFVALGSTIENFQYPQFVLIGNSSKKDYMTCQSIFKKVCLNNPFFFNLTLNEVEVAKVSYNAFKVLKISYANFIKELCEVKNINANKILNAISYDSVIGKKFITGGTPYGGTCFPRDARLFKKMCLNNRVSTKLIDFCEEENLRVYKKIYKKINKIKKLGILGISFKEKTSVIEGSPSLEIIKKYHKSKKIYCFDFLQSTFDDIDKKYNYTNSKSISECIKKSEMVLIMHNDKRFTKIYSKKIINLWG